MEIFNVSSTAALSLDCSRDVEGGFRLLSITIHAGATEPGTSVSESVVIRKISRRGTQYNTVLRTITGPWTDILVNGDPNEVFEAGDYVRIECSNNGTLKSCVAIIQDNVG